MSEYKPTYSRAMFRCPKCGSNDIVAITDSHETMNMDSATLIDGQLMQVHSLLCPSTETAHGLFCRSCGARMSDSGVNCAADMIRRNYWVDYDVYNTYQNLEQWLQAMLYCDGTIDCTLTVPGYETSSDLVRVDDEHREYAFYNSERREWDFILMRYVFKIEPDGKKNEARFKIYMDDTIEPGESRANVKPYILEFYHNVREKDLTIKQLNNLI